MSENTRKSQAIFMHLLRKQRPSIFYVLEQPSSSWGFKQDFMLTLAAALNLYLGIIQSFLF